MTDLRALLDRHIAFWRHEEADEPLVRALPRHERRKFENTDVTPDMLDVEELTPLVGRRNPDKGLVQGDLLRGLCAFSRIPWMEAIIGCEIHAGNDEAMWPRPALGPNLEGRERIVPTDDNPWLVKLLELTQALVDANDGTYVVTHTLQRGPSDMLSALVGDERMGLLLYDSPEDVADILRRASQAFIQVARAQYARIPPLEGGWVCWAYGLWAPGSVIRFQSDSSSQLSPRMYREQILPHDRTIMRAFEYSILDLHSAGTLHIHPALLETEELNAISVTLDRYANAPTVEELLPTFAAILEAKSLLVTGEMTWAELELIRRSLPARGLAINAQLTDKLLWQRGV
ncbi:MAG: hypothetical protein H5T69_02340 [Chloroflexi bacterium]|nr:hypothetical protein [Chloroflexota bacterium]